MWCAVENGSISVPYVNTLDNDADFFTKALSPGQFRFFRDRIMNISTEDARSAKSAARMLARGGVEIRDAPAGSEELLGERAVGPVSAPRV